MPVTLANEAVQIHKVMSFDNEITNIEISPFEAHEWHAKESILTETRLVTR